MKKLLLLIIALFMFAGCVDQQVVEDVPVIEETSEVLLSLENEYFSVTFPSEYIEERERYYIPKDGEAYLSFAYGVSDKEQMAQAQLLEKVKEGFAIKCTQTSACPEITANEDVELDSVPGIRFEKYIEGRNVDPTEGGFLKGYEYWFSHNGKLFIFHTQVSDLEDPDNAEKVFDEIMQTIEFK